MGLEREALGRKRDLTKGSISVYILRKKEVIKNLLPNLVAYLLFFLS
jgi:hypothetical protein